MIFSYSRAKQADFLQEYYMIAILELCRQITYG